MDDAHARELLARERTRIEEGLAGLSTRETGVEPVDTSQHPADQASELYDDTLHDSLAIQLRDELAAVERAEQRLAEGTYGRSIDSGEAIPDGRLELIPWAERTAEEQERYERS